MALAHPSDVRTYWRLTDAITTCVAHGRVILLDVANDRYLGLPEACESDFIHWLSNPAQVVPESCRESMISMNVVERDRLVFLRPAACTVSMPAPIDPDLRPPSPVSAVTLLSLGWKLFSAWHLVRSHRLQRALDHAFPALPPREGGRTTMEARLALFRSARPFLPIPRVCLHDCLALARWLGPASDVELVLGVSPYPFSAHCWVQAGGRVIDDHPQSPSRFHPILRLP